MQRSHTPRSCVRITDIRPNMLNFKTIKSNQLSLEDTLTLGKYSGSVLEDVINHDPLYVSWLFSTGIIKLKEPSAILLVRQLVELVTNKAASKLDTLGVDDDIPY